MTLQTSALDVSLASDTSAGVAHDRLRAPGYGVDVICMTAFDPLMRLHAPSDYRTPIYDLLRRLQVPAGLVRRDPDYGFDITGMLNQALTPPTSQQIEDGVRAQAAQVQAIRSVDVRVIALTNNSLRIHIAVYLLDSGRPYNLVGYLDDLGGLIVEGDI